jgi:NitT/TauT family transport system substrate-binding protein
MTPVSRKTALGAIAGSIAAPAFLRRVNAQGATKLKLTMSWLPEGTFAYVFVAKAKNFWKDRGLDVDISRGFGSLNSAQALAAKQFDFGMSTVDATIVLATKNVDLRCLALFAYVPTLGVAVLANSAIKTPKDLEGKTVGQTAASSDAAFFPAFCKQNGVDLTKVKIVNIDAKVRNSSLVENRVDAITGVATSILPALVTAGSSVRYFLYSDYGLKLYGETNLLARPEMIDGQPDLCHAFTQGFLDGLKFTLMNPDEAQSLFIGSVPELSIMKNAQQFAQLGMTIARYTAVSVPDPSLHGLGYTDPAKVARMAADVLTYEADMGTVKPNLPLMFSNRFIGDVTMTPAEWAAVRKNTPSITALLRASA